MVPPVRGILVSGITAHTMIVVRIISSASVTFIFKASFFQYGGLVQIGKKSTDNYRQNNRGKNAAGRGIG